MEQLSSQLSHYLWSLKKWEAHIETVVIPIPFTWFGCKYPQIKAESLQLKHILFVSFQIHCDGFKSIFSHPIVWWNHASMDLELHLMLTSTIRMGKKFDLSDFDCGMIVGARQSGLSIWDFHAQQSLFFAENGAKNKKKH